MASAHLRQWHQVWLGVNYDTICWREKIENDESNNITIYHMSDTSKNTIFIVTEYVEEFHGIDVAETGLEENSQTYKFEKGMENCFCQVWLYSGQSSLVRLL